MPLTPRIVRRVGAVQIATAVLLATTGDVVAPLLIGLGGAVGLATPNWRALGDAAPLPLAWWHVSSASMLLLWAGGVALVFDMGLPPALLVFGVVATVPILVSALDLAAGGRYVFPELRTEPRA